LAALRLGRPLWIWRGAFDDPGLTWPREMEGRGARRLDEGVVDSIIKIK
jgi:hypothetical protein